MSAVLDLLSRMCIHFDLEDCLQRILENTMPAHGIIGVKIFADGFSRTETRLNECGPCWVSLQEQGHQYF